MKKLIFVITALIAGALLCGCEALSLSDNIQPYFAGAEFSNNESYYKDYYYPSMDFEEAPAAIFQPAGYGAQYVDAPLFITGTVEETLRIDGVKYYRLSTTCGEMYISNRLFTLDKIKDASAVRMYFVYSGYNETLGCITGAYVDYSLIS